MFGLGFWELVVIAVVALLFIGPEKLPNFFRALGRATREFQRASRELRENLSIDEPPPAPKPPIRRPPAVDVPAAPVGAAPPPSWPTAEDAERRARQAAEAGRAEAAAPVEAAAREPKEAASGSDAPPKPGEGGGAGKGA